MSETASAVVPTPQQQPNLPTVPPARQIRVVEDDGPLAYLMDTARFEHVQRIARTMAIASICPAHLKGENLEEGMGNCFRVANQALRWGFDPFAVGDASYLVYGKLGYEGKLVAAVINARAKLAAPLNAIYNQKKGDELACVVFGSEKPMPESALPLLESYAETEDFAALNKLSFMGVMATRLTYGDGKTFEKDGKTVKGPWLKNVSQKLFYSCATKWARRWRPEILMGALTDDDLDEITTTVSPATEPPVGRTHVFTVPDKPIEQAPKSEAAPPAPEKETEPTPEAKSPTEAEMAAQDERDRITDMIKTAETMEAFDNIDALVDRGGKKFGVDWMQPLREASEVAWKAFQAKQELAQVATATRAPAQPPTGKKKPF